MKKLLLVLCLALLGVCGSADAQNYRNYDDVIYGTDGSIVRGTIIEQVPGVSYKIATRDGNVFVYDALKVERITKEPPINNYYAQPSNTAGKRYDDYGNVLYRKSPFWSALGSFFIPGLGQVINGQVNKGVWLFVGNVASISTFYVGATIASGTESDAVGVIALAGLAGYVGTYVYSLLQAPIYAVRWNETNGFALGGDKWLKMEPTVGVSNTIATGTNATCGMRATLTF